MQKGSFWSSQTREPFAMCLMHFGKPRMGFHLKFLSIRPSFVECPGYVDMWSATPISPAPSELSLVSWLILWLMPSLPGYWHLVTFPLIDLHLQLYDVWWHLLVLKLILGFHGNGGWMIMQSQFFLDFLN